MLLLSGLSSSTQQQTFASPLKPQEQQSLQSSSSSEIPYVNCTDTDWNEVLHPPPTDVPLCELSPTDHLPIPSSDCASSTHPNIVSYSSDIFQKSI
eukprot:2047951-Ditylum_brightwellii.AAC.1